MVHEQGEREEDYENKSSFEQCIASPERQRELIKERYGLGNSIVKIAEALQSNANSIRQVLSHEQIRVNVWKNYRSRAHE